MARHMANQRKTASHGGGQQAVEVRRPAPVVRRPDMAPVMSNAVSAVRRRTGRATVFVITGARVAATHERTRTRSAGRSATVSSTCHRHLGVGARRVGGADQGPLRPADACGRAGGRLPPPHRLGTTRRAPANAAPQPTDGLDRRPVRRPRHSHRDDHLWDAAPVGGRAGRRLSRRLLAAHPDADDRRPDCVGDLAGQRDLETTAARTAGARAGRAVADELRHGSVPPGPPHTRPREYERDRHPGRGRAALAHLGIPAS